MLSKTKLWHFFMIVWSCTSEYQNLKVTFDTISQCKNVKVFLRNEDHNSDLLLFLLVVLVSSEHRLQLVFYHLLASLLTCRRPPPPHPLSSLGSTTAAKGVTHLLMRAAIDSSLTPGLWRGCRQGGAPKKTFASVEQAACSTLPCNCKKALTGIIFTLLDYFPHAPPTEWEGVKERILQDRERRWRGGEYVSTNIYLWMAGCLPKRMGLKVCENKEPSLGRHIFQPRWC